MIITITDCASSFNHYIHKQSVQVLAPAQVLAPVPEVLIGTGTS